MSLTGATEPFPRGRIIWSGPSGAGDPPRVAVTFDEYFGDQTERILDTFDEHDMKGTFFTVGANSRAYPGDAPEILGRGHELGNHSWSHVDLTATGGSGFLQYKWTQEEIALRSGYTPAVARPPFGRWNEGVLQSAKDNGLWTILWDNGASVYQMDPTLLAENVLRRVSKGQIILLHQIEACRKALPRILRGLDNRGLESVRVTTLLGGEFT